jgi:molybdopterin-guanine dinucleotide biosynthesis protein A
METTAASTHPAYPEPLDAIVLAGTDDNPRRMILGQNKALLEIGGRPLVRRVVDALLASPSVGQVFVVGPLRRLQAALAGMPPQVSLVQQQGKMLANAWAAIHAAEAFHASHGNLAHETRPYLFLSSDLPLITTDAVEDFIDRCAAEDSRSGTGFSMLCGVAEEASLRQYYPQQGREGIRRPYVNLADCKVRLANIYVGRPRTLSNQAFLQVGFEHRKAEKWKNVLFLTWRFLSQSHGWQAAWLSLRLQATLMASRNPGKLYRRLREGNTTERVETVCGKVLGGSIRMVISPYGGLSLDADNQDDFQVLNRRFGDWIEYPPIGP